MLFVLLMFFMIISYSVCSEHFAEDFFMFLCFIFYSQNFSTDFSFLVFSARFFFDCFCSSVDNKTFYFHFCSSFQRLKEKEISILEYFRKFFSIVCSSQFNSWKFTVCEKKININSIHL